VECLLNLTFQACAKIINNAKNIVVLTGAGISTESGIKDFRSRTGIYKMAPEHILSLDYFYEYPKEFYQFALENLYLPDAKPNIGHEVLVKWENEGRVKHIITQNIDGLHQKAGSHRVIEFHGTIKTASCLNCGYKYSIDDITRRMSENDQFFICDQCDSETVEARYIKPEVVLFGDTGEWFTEEGFEYILNIIEKADCLLVLGTSLKVTPFSLFPQYKIPGAPMIIVNKGDTPYDFAKDTFLIQDSIGKTLLELDSQL
jgi:NAD-dependent deacetylase